MTTVAIEGIDGAGKATQTELLRARLVSSGFSVGVRSFPVYESFFGSTIRQLLDGRLPHSAETVDPCSMALWYALDRWEAVRALDRTEYDWLILNRFTLSNAVYQSARVEVAGTGERQGLDLDDPAPPVEHFSGWGSPGEDQGSDRVEVAGGGEADVVFHWVLDLEHRHLGLPVPDVTVVLDVEPGVSQDRSGRRAEEAGGDAAPDVYERSSTLLDVARRRYLRAADELADVVVVPCLDSSGDQRPAAEVHEDVMRRVM